MKRRDFIKGLVAAPVVAKVGIDAIAKPKSSVVFASVLEENPTLALAPDVLIVPKNLEATARRIVTKGNVNPMWPGIDKWFAEEYGKTFPL